MTFLEQTAHTIFDRHQTRMDDVWVILPTRRAVTVFLDHLAYCSDQPFLAPHTLAVDDFITYAAGLQLIDPVNLLFELFEVFKQIDENLEFEPFIGWASVLLADFDRIDQYMVKPSYLFDYLTAAKSIERWQLDLPPGAKSITETPGTTRYFKLFENLNTAYHALQIRLEEKGLAYRGMAYRRLADNVETRVRDNTAYEKIYFVGFNALTRAEERIFQVLLESGKAEMFWDVDAYYLNDYEQEAGQFLRKYRNNGWFFSKRDRERVEANLTTTKKHIRVVGVPNASMQAKVAGEICKETTKSKTLKTAIVLADETLLVPVLYALDESVTDLNVTMGLSLRNSLLFTLVDALFEMQRTVHEFRTRDGRDMKIPKFHHRHVIKVLNHPFVRQYERIKDLMSPDVENELPKPLFTWIVEKIIAEQRAYLTEREMRELGQQDPLVQVLFTRWNSKEPTKVIQVLYELIDRLREVYRSTQDAIETEYLYLFYTLLKQLETTFERQKESEGASQVTVRSFRQFLYELIRQTSIPFTSEGNSQIQVMGMLETRALDFDRVIILSANEGILPQSRRLNSLIPFDISVEKGIELPTYREQESVMAYHFYRLLQRASDIVLMYTTSPDAYGPGKGEPSRYIRQIEYELAPQAQGNITLSYPTVRFGRHSDATPVSPEWQVEKTAGIMAQLRHTLTEHGLYPTALNQFIDCSMAFYFSRVVGIAEEEDVEEKMGAAEFGSWLHLTLENLDKEYRMQGKPVTEEVVKNMLETTFKQAMKGRVIESGMNLLMYQTAQQLMLNFQRRQAQLEGLTVLDTERKLETFIDVPVSDQTLRIKIAGKIDRIEQINGQIRIVDYKTGAVKLPSDRSLQPIAEKLPLESGTSWAKVRQLWLYKYLYLKSGLNTANLPVTAGFYSFRDKEGALKANVVQFATDETPAQFVEASEEVLRGIIQQMLDSQQPFFRTDNLQTCKYCHFKGICGR